jgi:hypothetical protein
MMALAIPGFLVGIPYLGAHAISSLFGLGDVAGSFIDRFDLLALPDRLVDSLGQDHGEITMSRVIPL